MCLWNSFPFLLLLRSFVDFFGGYLSVCTSRFLEFINVAVVNHKSYTFPFCRRLSSIRHFFHASENKNWNKIIRQMTKRKWGAEKSRKKRKLLYDALDFCLFFDELLKTCYFLGSSTTTTTSTLMSTGLEVRQRLPTLSRKNAKGKKKCEILLTIAFHCCFSSLRFRREHRVHLNYFKIENEMKKMLELELMSFQSNSTSICRSFHCNRFRWQMNDCHRRHDFLMTPSSSFIAIENANENEWKKASKKNIIMSHPVHFTLSFN